MSIVDYIKNNSSLLERLNNVLELGSGNFIDLEQIATKIDVCCFAIDKKTPKKIPKNISFIESDYFNIDKVDRVIADQNFDLFFCNYTLCFNPKEKILECLPYYFEKIESGGIFYLSDFTKNEEVVKKRTNLQDDWFFNLVRKYFKSYEISEQIIYEKEHDHYHHIFELIAYK